MNSELSTIADVTLGEKLSAYLAEAGVSQDSFARRLGVTQSAVAQWISGAPIKAERVLDAAKATGWRVTPHDWRADLYPHRDDGMPRSVNPQVVGDARLGAAG